MSHTCSVAQFSPIPALQSWTKQLCYAVPKPEAKGFVRATRLCWRSRRSSTGLGGGSCALSEMPWADSFSWNAWRSKKKNQQLRHLKLKNQGDSFCAKTRLIAAVAVHLDVGRLSGDLVSVSQWCQPSPLRSQARKAADTVKRWVSVSCWFMKLLDHGLLK